MTDQSVSNAARAAQGSLADARVMIPLALFIIFTKS